MKTVMINLWTIVILSVMGATNATFEHSIKSRLHRELRNGRKLIEASDPSKVIDGQFIVVFDSDIVLNVTDKACQLFTAEQISFVYDTVVMKGVAIRNATSQLLDALELDTEILFIEPEITMSYGATDVLYNATYNLDRLDNKKFPLDHIYKRKSDGGKGVTVFVLDSGIRLSHIEFEGRASCGFDAIYGYESDIPCDDLHGHGTHLAGLIGGKTVGVAKQVTIVSVKVASKDFIFEGSAVLYGIQYILLQKLGDLKKPMVVNMSFGGERFFILDFMVEALLSVGISVVASAGNDGMNACNFSPSGIDGVITVGASNELDTVPSWSNFGFCVDVYAPGINILSAGKRNDTRYVISSGTSQASPMVAGTVALYLQMQPMLTPAQVFRLIVTDSLKNVLRPDVNNTNVTAVRIYKNRLLQTGIFTDIRPQRKNPTCPYTGRNFHLCKEEGWLKK